MSDNELHVFISYSHADKQWFERLQIHLRPLSRKYDIDVWEDTRIKPGAKWRENIQRAIEKAQAAILMISADFLASDFIHTDELPPLLKAAEEEGTIILPIIVAPCLYHRIPELSQFHCVNDPARSLVETDRGGQEKTFVKIAERILELAEAPQRTVENTTGYNRENFLEGETWIRLIKIGNWIFDQVNSTIIGAGMYAYLLSRQEFGEIPFVIQTKLHFSNYEQHLTHSVNKMNAGVILGWNSDKSNPRYVHIMMTGEELVVEKVGYNGGEAYRDFEHITHSVPLSVDTHDKYQITIRVGSENVEVVVNDAPKLSFPRPTGIVGRVGLRPWRSQMSCEQFSVSEESGSEQVG